MAETQGVENFQAHMTPEGVDPFGAMGLDPETGLPVGEGKPEGGTSDLPPSDGDTPGVEAGQGDSPTPEGQGDAKPLFEKLGFASWDDLAKAYENLRPEYTRVTQEKAELEKRLKAPQQQIQEQPKPRELTPEELEELRATDPEKAVLYRLSKDPNLLREVLGMLPEFQYLVNVANRFEASNVLEDVRTRHADFKNYEEQITDYFLKELGDGYSQYLLAMPEGKGLDIAYELMSLRKFRNDIIEARKKVENANKQVEEKNKGAVNMGQGNLNPNVTSNSPGKKNPYGLDDFHMDFVMDPLGHKYR